MIIARRAIFVMALCAIPVTASADGQSCLTQLETRIERDHVGVMSLIPQAAEALLRTPDDVLILDVRDRTEFAVSHLPGAIHVDPDIRPDEFVTRFGSALNGKTLLLYCSVGVRSSRLAQRIDAHAQSAGAKGTYNLRGGLFAWHNYGKGLRRTRQTTDFVHPYSTRWQSYLDFPELARYSAK